MKNETRELLGFKVPVVGVVETLDEAVSAAGSTEQVVKDYNANVLAHSHFTVLRRVIVATLEKLTGVKRTGKTVGEGDAAKFTPTEKEGVYVARLEAELGEEVLQTHAQAIAAECEKIPVDYKPGVRGTGEGAAPAAKWLAYYDQLVKEGKLDRFCTKYQIDTTQDEADLKVDVANKARELVLAATKAAEQKAMAGMM